MELITERLNAVMDALEQSLTDKPDKEELSRIARCSYSDLNSLFLLLAEVSVAEYVRKRRLTLAGIELKYHDGKVLDTALKYGYDSPVSFARVPDLPRLQPECCAAGRLCSPVHSAPSLLDLGKRSDEYDPHGQNHRRRQGIRGELFRRG